MELGERLRRARLEAGLSQRQLCGEEITRNMLSLIENGSARPSMDTLRYLADRLQRPVSYFLEEQSASPVQQKLLDARQAYGKGDWAGALALLAWEGQDAIFDPERYLLEALCRMELARQALEQGKPILAETLLEQAARAGSRTPYYGGGHERQRLGLLYTARPDLAGELAEKLPPEPNLTLLLAAAQDSPERMGALLDAMPADTARWHRLRGDACFGQGDYEKAISHYRQAEPDRSVCEKLEICCRELGDFKGAYHYACRLRSAGLSDGWSGPVSGGGDGVLL